MNAKKAKQARALAHHVEYGGYYPAMERSGKELEAMGLSAKQRKRADAMAERKVKKQVFMSEQERIREEAKAANVSAV